MFTELCIPESYKTIGDLNTQESEHHYIHVVDVTMRQHLTTNVKSLVGSAVTMVTLAPLRKVFCVVVQA